MIAIIRASRPINLLIVGLTQYLFYNIFFLQYEDTYELSLYPILIFPFIAVTILIAAGGYYINDYFDDQSDRANDKAWKLDSKYSYLSAYFVVFILGWLLSYWIAYRLDRLSLSVIYLVAAGILFLYSSHLKKLPLIGNVVVSVFSAFVLLIIIYSEYAVFQNQGWRYNALSGHAVPLILFYSTFIFVLSFLRELIKDMEDISGDKVSGYRTYPIVAGIQRSKNLSMFLSLTMIIISIVWIYNSYEVLPHIKTFWFLLSIVLPSVFLTFKIFISNDKKAYHNISSGCKLLMFSGLIYIIVIAWI